ncbi:RING-H2 finger protein ATL2-like [Elaeis guineensis]|uniref:RING-H2 finger protein ATL2-like n=1 Tax=Elaeis guineensis var. tenera TaxID=51953 RepID=UPI003C6DB4AF
MAENRYTLSLSHTGSCHPMFTKQGKFFFSGFLALLAIILVFICWNIDLFSCRNRRIRTTTTTATISTTINSPCDGRLNARVLSSLPVFTYSSGAHEDKLKCAVCFTEFVEGEKGRLLPRCYHSFHAECVDMWFNSHSTCPLCRAIV